MALKESCEEVIGEIYRAAGPESVSHSIPDSLIVRYSHTVCRETDKSGRWGRMEGTMIGLGEI